jgi:hypothetical protein
METAQQTQVGLLGFARFRSSPNLSDVGIAESLDAGNASSMMLQIAFWAES